MRRTAIDLALGAAALGAAVWVARAEGGGSDVPRSPPAVASVAAVGSAGAGSGSGSGEKARAEADEV